MSTVRRSTRKRRAGMKDSNPALIRNPHVRCGSFVIANAETKRSLANGRGQRKGIRTKRYAASRVSDRNGPRVQLAQGRLCRTAQTGFRVIAGERVFTSSCPYMEGGAV